MQKLEVEFLFKRFNELGEKEIVYEMHANYLT